MAERTPDTVQEEVALLQDRFQKGEIARDKFEQKMQELAEKTDETANGSSGSATEASSGEDREEPSPARRVGNWVRGPRISPKQEISQLINSLEIEQLYREIGRYLWAVVPPAVFATGTSLLTYTLIETGFGPYAGMIAGVLVFILALGAGTNWVNPSTNNAESKAV